MFSLKKNKASNFGNKCKSHYENKSNQIGYIKLKAEELRAEKTVLFI